MTRLLPIARWAVLLVLLALITALGLHWSWSAGQSAWLFVPLTFLAGFELGAVDSGIFAVLALAATALVGNHHDRGTASARFELLAYALLVVAGGAGALARAEWRRLRARRRGSLGG